MFTQEKLFLDDYYFLMLFAPNTFYLRKIKVFI